MNQQNVHHLIQNNFNPIKRNTDRKKKQAILYLLHGTILIDVSTLSFHLSVYTLHKYHQDFQWMQYGCIEGIQKEVQSIKFCAIRTVLPTTQAE